MQKTTQSRYDTGPRIMMSADQSVTTWPQTSLNATEACTRYELLHSIADDSVQIEPFSGFEATCRKPLFSAPVHSMKIGWEWVARNHFFGFCKTGSVSEANGSAASCSELLCCKLSRAAI